MCKGPNALVVSLVGEYTNESHVAAIVERDGTRLIMDSAEKLSLNLTSESLGWSAGGTGMIGGVAQVFGVRFRIRQAKRVNSNIQDSSGSLKRSKSSSSGGGGSPSRVSLSAKSTRDWGFNK